jgi:hypothetical protein
MKERKKERKRDPKEMECNRRGRQKGVDTCPLSMLMSSPTVSHYFSLHISSYFLLVSREGIYLSALGLILGHM